MLRPRLLRLLAAAPHSFLAASAVGLAVLGLEVARAWAIAGALGPLALGEPVAAVTPEIAAALVVTAALAAAGWWRGRLALRAAVAVKRRLRHRLCAHLLRLGPAWVSERSSGELRTVLVDAVEAVEGYFGQYLPRLLVAWLGSCAVLLAIARLDAPTAAVIAAAWLALLVGPQIWERLLGDFGRAHWRAYGRYSAELLEALRGMATLVAFGASRRRGEALRRRGVELYRATRAQMALAVARVGFANLATGLGSALAVGLAAVRCADGHLAFADLVVILMLAGVALRPVADLEQQWLHGYAGVTAEPHLFELLDHEPAVRDRISSGDASPAEDDAALVPVGAPPTIRFEGVGLVYRDEGGEEGEETHALRDVGFEIEAGSTLAVVGTSGAGKSTLVSLLLRFLDPSTGRVLLDGRDLRDLPLARVRRTIAWVSQDIVLFPGTLAENLRFARPDASDEDLADAARRASFDAVVAERPGGWSARLGAEGGGLSGGERQRLALARALLADAPMLILDEATAHLDGACEAAVHAALRAEAGRRTLLVITHRLASVRDADRVIVLDRGRLVQEGSPSALVARGGAYGELWAAQHGARREAAP